MPGKKLLTKEKEEEHRNGEEDRDVTSPAPAEEEPRPGQFVLLSEHHRRLSVAAEDDQMDELGHDLNVEMSLNGNKQSKYSPRMREKHAKFNLRARSEWLQETAPILLSQCNRFDYEQYENYSWYLSVAPDANVIDWNYQLTRRANDDVARQPRVPNNAHQVDDVAQQPMDQDNMDEGDAASSQSGTHKKKGNQRGSNKNKNNGNNKNKKNNHNKKRNKK